MARVALMPRCSTIASAVTPPCSIAAITSRLLGLSLTRFLTFGAPLVLAKFPNIPPEVGDHANPICCSSATVGSGTTHDSRSTFRRGIKIQREISVIIAGDVGGTKCNLALFAESNGNLVSVFKERFASKDFAQFDLIVCE